MTDKEIHAVIMRAVKDVREKNPLTPSITNTVTQDFVANAQLAIGGSAAMIYQPDECESFAKIASAFYINLGTVMAFYSETIPRAVQSFNENRKPWVLDPVGIGVGELRMKLLMQIKDFKPTIIRGNASEIITLAQRWQLIDNTGGKVRGVDSTEKVSAAEVAAVALAKFTGGAIAVSGEEDLVTDGEQKILCAGGSELSTKITGSGCALGGVMAVYSAVTTPFIAALTATIIFNQIGTKISSTVNAPASFKIHFLDELYRLNELDCEDFKRI